MALRKEKFYALLRTNNKIYPIKIKREGNELYSFKSPVTNQRELITMQPSETLLTFKTAGEALQTAAKAGIRTNEINTEKEPEIKEKPNPYKHKNRTSRIAKACEILDNDEESKRRQINEDFR